MALGSDHPDVAMSYNNMAIVYKNQGKYVEALEQHQKALDIKLVALGSDHPNVAMSYNNMAIVYYNQGKYAEALELYHKALDIMLVALPFV